MHRTLTCSAGSPGSIPAVGVGVKVMSNIQSHFFLLGIRWLIYIENKSLARNWVNSKFSSRMKKRSLPYHLWGKMWGQIYDDLISLFSFFIRRGCTSSTSFAVSSLSSAPDARPTSTRWAQFLPLKKSIFAVWARKEPVFHPSPEIEVVQRLHWVWFHLWWLLMVLRLTIPDATFQVWCFNSKLLHLCGWKPI